MDKFVPDYSNKSYIDGNFDFDELEVERIYDYLAVRYKDSLTIKVVSADTVPYGCSRLVEVDYDNRVLNCGVEDPGEVEYPIVPDKLPCAVVEENLNKLDRGDLTPFEFVPVAEPSIPANKFYNYEAARSLEIEMIRMGCKIVDPTPGQVKLGMNDSYVSSLAMDEGYYFDRYGFVTGTERDIRNRRAVVIALQFNPFNLTSTQFITSLDVSQWENFGYVTGRYKIKGVEYSFKYDINDTRYRVHSDNWTRNLKLDTESQNYYGMYDMVSTKEFHQWLRNCPSFTVYSNAIIGSIISDRMPSSPFYSVIGPWEGSIRAGNKEVFFSPSCTVRMRVNKNNKKRFRWRQYSYVGGDLLLDDGKILKMERGKLLDANYFVRYVDNLVRLNQRNGKVKKIGDSKGRLTYDTSMGVLYERIRDEEIEEGDLFYEFPFRIKGCPMNKYGSLAGEFRIYDLMTVVEDMQRPEIDRKMDLFMYCNRTLVNKITLLDEYKIDGIEPPILKEEVVANVNFDLGNGENDIASDVENQKEVGKTEVIWMDDTWKRDKEMGTGVISGLINYDDRQFDVFEITERVKGQKITRGIKEEKTNDEIYAEYVERKKVRDPHKNFRKFKKSVVSDFI